MTSSPFHQITILPINHFTKSPFHQITISSNHYFTKSPNHYFTSSPFHQITISPSHQITISLNHCFIKSLFNPITISQNHRITTYFTKSHSELGIREPTFHEFPIPNYVFFFLITGNYENFKEKEVDKCGGKPFDRRIHSRTVLRPTKTDIGPFFLSK